MARGKKVAEAPTPKPAALGQAFLFLNTTTKGHVAAFAVGDIVVSIPVTVEDPAKFAESHSVVEVGDVDDDDEDDKGGAGSGSSGE